jgi:hypothetical protein
VFPPYRAHCHAAEICGDARLLIIEIEAMTAA